MNIMAISGINYYKDSVAFGSNNPRVLITGATGYIGNHLSQVLAKDGYDLVVCGKNPQKLKLLEELLGQINSNQSNKNSHHFVNIELTDQQQMSALLRGHNDVEAVIHLAGINSNGKSIVNPSETYSVNLAGTLNLLNSMQENDVTKLLFISTGNVYGQAKNIDKLNETIIPNPETPYAKSKLMIEQLIQAYKSLGLQSTILRLFNVAGAGSSEDLTMGANVIAIIMNRLKNGIEFVLNGNKHNTPDGTTIRDYLHVDDACNAMKVCLNKLLHTEDSSLYNVGSGCGTSLQKIIDLSEQISGKKAIISINPNPQPEPPVLIVDNSKIIQETGWRPQHDIKSIISSAWEWCINH